MTADPRVSIGLPVFNGEKHLDKTLESLVGQTFQDFEIIISDNGSTDRTEDICRAWAARDSRIRYLRSPENRGAAWNFGRVFEESRGTYFKWATDDDTLMPEWLEECVAVLDGHPDVVVAYTKVVEIDENDDILASWDKYVDVTAEDPVDRLRPVFYYWRCFPVVGLIRREALARTQLIGPYDSSDRVVLGELCLVGKFHRVDKHLYCHREHPENSMNAYRTQQERGAWFDPKNTNPLTYWPNWRYHVNFALAILRAPLGGRDRLRALAALGMQMIRARKPLLSDFRVVGRALLDKLPGRAPISVRSPDTRRR